MQITNNKKLSRFETQLPDGEYAIIEYRWLKAAMVLMHTFVPNSGRGQGIADELAKYALEYIRAHHLKAIIYCTFILKYVERHPGYEDIIQEKR
ncbi:MAG: GNAT family N-acetyltransferase [Bacteroidota bacterium]